MIENYVLAWWKNRLTANVAMVVLSLPVTTFADATPMRGVMSPTQFNASDFQALGQYKVNLIRWQIQRNWGRTNTERDVNDYNSWLAGKRNELDQVLAAAQTNGLKVVIDLHTPPGGRYADKSMAMFYEQVYNDRFIQIWQENATRYKGNPAVWAYDLVNEPTQNNSAPPEGMDSTSTQKKRRKPSERSTQQLPSSLNRMRSFITVRLQTHTKDLNLLPEYRTFGMKFICTTFCRRLLMVQLVIPGRPGALTGTKISSGRLCNLLGIFSQSTM
jgi:hypothetical protein